MARDESRFRCADVHAVASQLGAIAPLWALALGLILLMLMDVARVVVVVALAVWAVRNGRPYRGRSRGLLGDFDISLGDASESRMPSKHLPLKSVSGEPERDDP
jgi:hypothetical protein